MFFNIRPTLSFAPPLLSFTVRPWALSTERLLACRVSDGCTGCTEGISNCGSISISDHFHHSVTPLQGVRENLCFSQSPASYMQPIPRLHIAAKRDFRSYQSNASEQSLLLVDHFLYNQLPVQCWRRRGCKKTFFLNTLSVRFATCFIASAIISALHTRPYSQWRLDSI